MQSGISLFSEHLRAVRRQVLVDSRSGGYDNGPERLSNNCFVRFLFLLDVRSNSDVFLYLDSSRVLELACNVGSPGDVLLAKENDAEALGLYRTEFLFLENRDTLPSEEAQFKAYRLALEQMKGKRVVVRTLDIGGDKKLQYLPTIPEDNPFLGHRAIRLCLANEDIFKVQIRALLKASIYGKLAIMFPMIATQEEFMAAKSLVINEKSELLKAGIPVSDDIEIGMMIEVPSAAIMAEELAQISDFFSIGTNDLIQYTMAADRTLDEVGYLYQPLNPAILRLIKMTVDGAHKAGKWVGICGEMAADEKAAILLLGLGLDEFSVNPKAVLPLRGKILNVEKASVDKLLDSEQIKTLVLALGTQLREDFDLEKLRYHRIILMTDADVDGAHIRTLLLTFFYRQMPQLIERGHVYIAQPPLYGIFTGKRDKATNKEKKIYIKDDAEMAQYLLNIALKDAALYRSEEDFNAGVSIRGTDLEKLIEEFEQSKSVIERLCQVIDKAALLAISSGVQIDISDEQKASASALNLEKEIRDPEIKVAPQFDKEKERWRLCISHYIYGNTHHTFIDPEFLRSHEYATLVETAQALEGVIKAGARVVRGDVSQGVKNFGEAVRWLLDQAEAGVRKQRYKGLGEMNSEELYETTMNPQTRRLLRVRLEDASKADDIFSMLMGDEVEPRRDFIEENALFVSNLDI